MILIPVLVVRWSFILTPVFLFSFGLHAQKTEILWSGIPPGDIAGEVGEEKIVVRGVKRVSNVSEPSITYFLSDSKKATGATVLVCPGGAYNILAIEHEGEDVCQWLNEIGVHAVLLKYRVPRRKNREPHAAPLQDAQRAMGLIRRAGKNWKVPLTKLGLLGFSAGGNLAVMAATSFQSRSYEEVDSSDNLSCRPDFAMLIYPAYLLDEEKKDRLLPHLQFNQDSPPFFFVHTEDDHIPAEGSILTHLALIKAGVVGNELHIYPFGGHGYGLRPSKHSVSQWPKRAQSWLESMGLIRE